MGFTATTNRQLSVDNADRLHDFDCTLLPLVKGFKGKLVKSIGGTMLFTFRSPTNAMLCSMALQDAIHGLNLKKDKKEKIHIRLAANLGEVRVTNNDIFGEPVNVASRIKGIASADEIYLSEAVHMAMNKAEVPVKEFGLIKLKGINYPVKVYSIPRFANPHLVTNDSDADEKGSELLYPYGGMHYQTSNSDSAFDFDFHLSNNSRLVKFLLPIIIALILVIIAQLGYLYFNGDKYNGVVSGSSLLKPASDAPYTQPVQPVVVNNLQSTLPDKSAQPQAELSATISDPEINKKSTEEITLQPEPSKEFAAPPAIVKPPVVQPITIPASTPIAQPVAKPKPESVPYKPVVKKPRTKTVPKKPRTKAAAKKPETKTVAKKPETKLAINKLVTKAVSKEPKTISDIWNITTAKSAYRARILSKTEYREIIRELKLDYKGKITKIKSDYRSNKITREQYKQEVRKAKLKYKTGKDTK